VIENEEELGSDDETEEAGDIEITEVSDKVHILNLGLRKRSLMVLHNNQLF
jgi:hypothetical protein